MANPNKKFKHEDIHSRFSDPFKLGTPTRRTSARLSTSSKRKIQESIPSSIEPKLPWKMLKFHNFVNNTKDRYEKGPLGKVRNPNFSKTSLIVLKIEIDCNGALGAFKKFLRFLSPWAKSLKGVHVILNASNSMSFHIVLFIQIFLSKCTQLERVCFQIEHSEVSQQVLNSLVFLLKNTKKLRILDLLFGGNHFRTSNMLSLIKMLQRKQDLLSLNLHFEANKLDDKFLRTLIPVIVSLKNLKTFALSLCLNPVTESGIGVLSLALKELVKRLKKISIDLKKLECDNIAYLNRLFGQYRSISWINISY